MSSKETSWRKLTEFVTDHIFRDVNRDEFIAVMNGDRMTYEIRRDR